MLSRIYAKIKSSLIKSVLQYTIKRFKAELLLNHHLINARVNRIIIARTSYSIRNNNGIHAGKNSFSARKSSIKAYNN